MRGFTLIELMVVLAVIALAVTFAVPNLAALSDGAQYRKAIRDVVSAAHQARCKAMHHNASVDLLFEPSRHRYALRHEDQKVGDVEFFELPESLQLSVTAAAQLSPTEGISVIRFYPQGGSSGGDIELVRETGAGTLLQVSWLLADVRQRSID